MAARPPFLEIWHGYPILSSEHCAAAFAYRPIHVFQPPYQQFQYSQHRIFAGEFLARTGTELSDRPPAEKDAAPRLGERIFRPGRLETYVKAHAQRGPAIHA